MKQTHTAVRGISLPVELDQELVAFARRHDRTISMVVRRALELYLAPGWARPRGKK